MIDGGVPLPEARALLESAGAVHRRVEARLGQRLPGPSLDEKLALLREHDVVACAGGTLLEVAAYQGRAGECLDWMPVCGFDHVEVSDGLGLLGEDAKAAMIRQAAASFRVVAEVGMKQPIASSPPATWVELALADLDAGAAAVIAEGRESGTVGIYAADGSVRADVVDALLDHVGADRIIFEAPRKDQQAWIIRYVGHEVNLANVAPREPSASRHCASDSGPTRRWRCTLRSGQRREQPAADAPTARSRSPRSTST